MMFNPFGVKILEQQLFSGKLVTTVIGNCAVLVQTDSLSKRYGAITALDQCNLEVEQGEVFGLLGPNGAGKTTLLRLLLGFLRPSSGRATIGPFDCYRQSVRVRREVSYLPGEARLFRQMRGRDVLAFFTQVRRGGDYLRAQHFADRLQLDLSRRVALMSTGMRQKLALAITLAAETPLIILDEPTSNLDPTVRSTVIQMVAEAKAAGRTVLFSSHVLSEVEQVCDRVVILNSGQVVHTQVMSQLRLRHRIVATLHGPIPQVPLNLTEHLTIQSNGAGRLTIETAGELSPLLGWLASLSLEEVSIQPLGLQAVYDQYHGRADSAETAEPDPQILPLKRPAL